MDASYDYSNGSWYRPKGQSQAVRPAPRAVNRAQPINTRAHYRPAQNTMAPAAGPPHYKVAKQARSALPSDYSPAIAAITATGRAERYTRTTPKYRPHSAQRQARRTSKPQVYVRVNEQDMNRSWYVPKRSVQPKKVMRSRGHAKRANGDSERRGGSLKDLYEAVKRMFSGL